MKAIFKASVASVALIASTAAMAGNEPQAGSAQERASEARPESGVTGTVANGDIVVTAQRRSESLLSVPISITALTSDSLVKAGITDTQSLFQSTPGMVVIRSSYNGQPTIRGVSTFNAGPGDEPNVASYVDGVYQPEQFGTIQELANVERVEVLKGPQGTLFGRNATGGAISVVTRKPSSETEGDFSLNYGRFNYFKASGYISGPLIGDTVAASLAGFYLRDDGYLYNVFLKQRQGGQEKFAIRGKVLMHISDAVEFGVNALYSKSHENAGLSGHSLAGNNLGRQLPNPNNYPLDILFPQGDFDTATGFVPDLAVRLTTIDAHLNADLGFADLAALASYSDGQADVYADADVSPLAGAFIQPRLTSESWTQEVVLTSKPGRFEWLLGANAYQGNSQQNPMNANNSFNINGQRSDAAAVFVQGTYRIGEKLFLTAGLRFSWDRKEGSYRPLTSPVPTGTGRASWTDLAPRAVIRYQFNADSNVYASFSKGFKTGTFNTTSALGAMTPAEPEEIIAYEVGLKARVAQHLRLTLAAYHYDYTNLQTAINQTTSTGALFSILQNAPKSKIDGFEANIVWQPLEGLDINAGLSLLRAKVTQFTNASVAVPILINGVPSGNTTVTMNVSGNRLLRAPDQTLTIGASYRHSLPGGSTLTYTANGFFSAKWYNDLANRVSHPAYTIVNGSITWTDASQHFRFGVFAQNLTDERYYFSTTTSAFSDTIAFAKPRWFGVMAGYKL